MLYTLHTANSDVQEPTLIAKGLGPCTVFVTNLTANTIFLAHDTATLKVFRSNASSSRNGFRIPGNSRVKLRHWRGDLWAAVSSNFSRAEFEVVTRS